MEPECCAKFDHHCLLLLLSPLTFVRLLALMIAVNIGPGHEDLELLSLEEGEGRSDTKVPFLRPIKNASMEI